MSINTTEIRERCEKATPGPWFTGEANEAGLTRIDDGRSAQDALHPIYAETFDAEFIAHARTDIPALLDALDDGITRETQDRIRDELIRLSGNKDIDGSGCDSGDPVDLTIDEIGDAFSALQDEVDALRNGLSYWEGIRDENGTLRTRVKSLESQLAEAKRDLELYEAEDEHICDDADEQASRTLERAKADKVHPIEVHVSDTIRNYMRKIRDLKRDAKRLDWYACECVRLEYRSVSGEDHNGMPTESDWWECERGDGTVFMGDSWGEAVDAAMEASNE